MIYSNTYLKIKSFTAIYVWKNKWFTEIHVWKNKYFTAILVWKHKCFAAIHVWKKVLPVINLLKNILTAKKIWSTLITNWGWHAVKTKQTQNRNNINYFTIEIHCKILYHMHWMCKKIGCQWSRTANVIERIVFLDEELSTN